MPLTNKKIKLAALYEKKFIIISILIETETKELLPTFLLYTDKCQYQEIMASAWLRLFCVDFLSSFAYSDVLLSFLVCIM